MLGPRGRTHREPGGSAGVVVPCQRCSSLAWLSQALRPPSIPRLPARSRAGRRLDFYLSYALLPVSSGRGSSEVRRQQPRQTVAEPHREAAPIHLGESDRPRLPELLVTQPLLERPGEPAVVALQVELEVQPQAARIPV